MQPPVHQWKADTVARQHLPEGWEVGGGGWCWAGGDKENQLLYVLVFKVLNQISEIE